MWWSFRWSPCRIKLQPWKTLNPLRFLGHLQWAIGPVVYYYYWQQSFNKNFHFFLNGECERKIGTANEPKGSTLVENLKILPWAKVWGIFQRWSLLFWVLGSNFYPSVLLLDFTFVVLFSHSCFWGSRKFAALKGSSYRINEKHSNQKSFWKTKSWSMPIYAASECTSHAVRRPLV